MDQETRIKRLRIRSWRRGMKEMDLILGPFADERLPALDAALQVQYEALLEETDPDLYSWLLARMNGNPPDIPPHLQGIFDMVAEDALRRLRPVDKI